MFIVALFINDNWLSIVPGLLIVPFILFLILPVFKIVPPTLLFNIPTISNIAFICADVFVLFKLDTLVKTPLDVIVKVP